MRTRLRTLLPLAALLFGGPAAAAAAQPPQPQSDALPLPTLSGEPLQDAGGGELPVELASLRPLAGDYRGAELPENLPPSALIGAGIADVQGNRLARIRDLLADKRGKVLAVLAATGGFLGLGERRVAVPIEELILERRDGEDILSAMGEDELAELPDYEPPSAGAA